jgi:hypothetical protein
MIQVCIYACLRLFSVMYYFYAQLLLVTLNWFVIDFSFSKSVSLQLFQQGFTISSFKFWFYSYNCKVYLKIIEIIGFSLCSCFAQVLHKLKNLLTYELKYLCWEVQVRMLLLVLVNYHSYHLIWCYDVPELYSTLIHGSKVFSISRLTQNLETVCLWFPCFDVYLLPKSYVDLWFAGCCNGILVLWTEMLCCELTMLLSSAGAVFHIVNQNTG